MNEPGPRCSSHTLERLRTHFHIVAVAEETFSCNASAIVVLEPKMCGRGRGFSLCLYALTVLASAKRSGPAVKMVAPSIRMKTAATMLVHTRTVFGATPTRRQSQRGDAPPAAPTRRSSRHFLRGVGLGSFIVASLFSQFRKMLYKKKIAKAFYRNVVQPPKPL